ncbi:hypothetical protein OG896_24380 [Streptomyces sp. NBC_00669]|uniref:hypothetical protein n=1 Tax=Streptomyces sp. NBC_00669 TaxID=2976011 RepID=UPI002E327BCE|nr:hypothetical protein [Streptomyces sp. NBC_00669]
MADDAIPDDLLDLQRKHAAAMAETRRAAQDGGDVVAATKAEARLAAELLAYREAHPEWATVGAQKRLREAAGGA